MVTGRAPVKGADEDANGWSRCTRNCYNCPICTSVLSISSLEKPTDGLAPPDSDPSKQVGGPYFLSCPYCQWSSLDIGIQFEKHFNMTSQLQKIFKRGSNTRRASLLASPTSPKSDEYFEGADQRRSSIASGDDKSPTQAQLQAQNDHESFFTNLNSFYRTQLADLSDTNPYGMTGDYAGYNSPSSITRLMNLYSSGGRIRKDKPKQARDAVDPGEGLRIFDPQDDMERLNRLKSSTWEDVVTVEQRLLQCREHIKFVDELRPLAIPLRTKKSKRCRICRQILTRPEQKVSSTRYKIKLLAVSSIPQITLRSMSASQAPNRMFPMQSTTANGIAYDLLKPLTPTHFLLTISNPLFDPIRVTLATPSTTPGRVKSRVTIMCPQFDVGANTDVWDAELASATDRSSKRMSQMFGASGSFDGSSFTAIQAEAGKVWAKGRNWTSVVVEVVPGALPGSLGHITLGPSGPEKETAELEEDEDVLEMAVFVRLEYETEAGGEEGAAQARRGEDSGKEKREEAFWAVLGAGRISR